VTSLKDSEAIDFMRAGFAREKPDVILNATAFSARLDDGQSVLDVADAPVLQAIFSGASEAQWRADPRGLGAADLAMNVVLPEMDGRLVTRAIAFKTEALHRPELQFTPLTHEALPSRIKFVADLAAAWIHLRRLRRVREKIACILSDYPGKGGARRLCRRARHDAERRRDCGDAARRRYSIGPLPAADELMASLESKATERLSLADYKDVLRETPRAFVDAVTAAWGAPEADAAAREGFFSFSILRAGNFCLALQPDRGSALDRKARYHDGALAPRHAYIAFYVWLRRVANIDAMIHCGAHGTLEWLPGKAAALSEACAPEVVLGPMPVVYPFIVNNPGEAAQAKRRLSAVIIGHLTPPLMHAGAMARPTRSTRCSTNMRAPKCLTPKRARLLAKPSLIAPWKRASRRIAALKMM